MDPAAVHDGEEFFGGGEKVPFGREEDALPGVRAPAEVRVGIDDGIARTDDRSLSYTERTEGLEIAKRKVAQGGIRGTRGGLVKLGRGLIDHSADLYTERR